jgi:hypothetical protein
MCRGNLDVQDKEGRPLTTWNFFLQMNCSDVISAAGKALIVALSKGWGNSK